MKIIYNKKQSHTLQFENLQKKGFKSVPYSEYVKLQNESNKKIKSGYSFSKGTKEFDKKLSKMKYKCFLHNLEILKKNQDLKVPQYVYYGLDDLTLKSFMNDGETFKDIKDFNYHYKFPIMSIGSIKKTVYNENTEKLKNILKPLSKVLGGELYVTTDINIEMNTTENEVHIKHGKQISFYSSVAKFDLFHLDGDVIHLGEMKSFMKNVGIGNLVLGYILMATLDLNLTLVGLANVPEYDKGGKDVPDYHVLKKFYKKFDLEFNNNGWGKFFTSKNLIGNKQYLKELYISVNYFLDKWIEKLEEMKALKKAS